MAFYHVLENLLPKQRLQWSRCPTSDYKSDGNEERVRYLDDVYTFAALCY